MDLGIYAGLFFVFANKMDTDDTNKYLQTKTMTDRYSWTDLSCTFAKGHYTKGTAICLMKGLRAERRELLK